MRSVADGVLALCGQLRHGAALLGEIHDRIVPEPVVAARRVRLGLLRAEIGRENEISIERDDLLIAALESARGFSNPQQVLEFYRSNPNALERFRAPVFEDKVVAFLTELAEVKESVVEPEELFRDPDDEAEVKKVAKIEKSAKSANQKAGAPAANKKSAKKPAAKKKDGDKKTAKKKTAAKPKTTRGESGKKPAKSAAKTAQDD